MATAQEAATARTPAGADLAAGINAVSYDQTLIFNKYVRLILPLDGFVFWVRADLVSASAIMNASALNVPTLNQPEIETSGATTYQVQGSFHYATERRQEEAETYSVNRGIFSALAPVAFLNAISPGIKWITEFEGQKYSFSSRGSFYRQASVYHYVGDAVYADMETQLVDSVAAFDSKNLVVSNSLPAWLALNSFDP